MFNLKGVNMQIDDKLIYEYSRKLNVLYVENNDASRAEILPYLYDFFNEVDEAKDGETAFSMYKSYKEKTSKTYDIIISNIELPKLDGLELGWKVTKINPWQDIIFTSSYNNALKLKKAIQMGARGFLDKPVSVEHLRGIIFKMSKAVYDEKFAEEYYQNIEAANIELEEKNKELENKAISLSIGNNEKKLDNESYKLFKSEISALISSELDELLDTQGEIDLSISKCKKDLDYDAVLSMANHISHYGLILSSYSFFEDASMSFEDLSKIMTSVNLPTDGKNIEQIFMFLESFIYTLSKFQNSLEKLSEQEIRHFKRSIIDELNVISNRWRFETFK